MQGLLCLFLHPWVTITMIETWERSSQGVKVPKRTCIHLRNRRHVALKVFVVFFWILVVFLLSLLSLVVYWTVLCQSYEQILEFFRRDPNDFLSRLVTTDETWLYHYDPETKQQRMEQRHSGWRVQKSAGKVLASIFWDQDGILLIDCLPKGQTINAVYYSSLLV